MKISKDLIAKGQYTDNEAGTKPSDEDLIKLQCIETEITKRLKLVPCALTSGSIWSWMDIEVLRLGFFEIEPLGRQRTNCYLSPWVEVKMKESWQPSRGGEKLHIKFDASYCEPDISIRSVSPEGFADKVVKSVADAIGRQARMCKERADFLEVQIRRLLRAG